MVLATHTNFHTKASKHVTTFHFLSEQTSTQKASEHAAASSLLRADQPTVTFGSQRASHAEFAPACQPANSHPLAACCCCTQSVNPTNVSTDDAVKNQRADATDIACISAKNTFPNAKLHFTQYMESIYRKIHGSQVTCCKAKGVHDELHHVGEQASCVRVDSDALLLQASVAIECNVEVVQRFCSKHARRFTVRMKRHDSRIQSSHQTFQMCHLCGNSAQVLASAGKCWQDRANRVYLENELTDWR